MNGSPFFSIIVPVYNVEAYLEECINSILSQTFESFELLLIDDGSTDSSGKICDAFSQTSHNVIVSHKENGGQSSARNAGLRHAKGLYVIFVDSDDIVIRDCFLSDLYFAIIDNGMPDVALYPNLLMLDDKTRRYRVKRKCAHNSNCVLSGHSDLLKIVRDGFMTVAPWSKAIKKDLIDIHGLHFAEGESSEDYEWTFNILLTAREYAYLSECYYQYRFRPGSVSSSVNLDTMRRQISRMVSYIGNVSVPDVKDALYLFLSNMYVVYLICLATAGSKKKPPIEEVREFDFLFDHTCSTRGKLVRASRRVFGYDLTFRLLAFVYHFTSSGRRAK